MTSSKPLRLINTTTRPVELHLSSGSVIVPSLGEAPASDTDVAAPQIGVLVNSGVLVVRPAAPSAEAEAEEPPKRAPRRPARASESSERGRTRRGASGTRRGRRRSGGEEASE